MRFLELARDIWIGDRHACDGFGPDFPSVIHVWSDPDLYAGRVCRCLKESRGWGFPVKYIEGYKLAEADRSIDDVARYARRYGQLLIHCAACVCRAPTFGVIALVARGMEPFAAIELVYRKMWGRWRAAPLMFDRPMGEILGWWEREQRAR
jgi:hypothetical protein